MEIPKARVVQTLRDRGDHDRAQLADQQLPDRVNPSRHWHLLARLGIGPRDLPDRISGSWVDEWNHFRKPRRAIASPRRGRFRQL